VSSYEVSWASSKRKGKVIRGGRESGFGENAPPVEGKLLQLFRLVHGGK
jgi:hypothetical protein